MSIMYSTMDVMIMTGKAQMTVHRWMNEGRLPGVVRSSRGHKYPPAAVIALADWHIARWQTIVDKVNADVEKGEISYE